MATLADPEQLGGVGPTEQARYPKFLGAQLAVDAAFTDGGSIDPDHFNPASLDRIVDGPENLDVDLS